MFKGGGGQAWRSPKRGAREGWGGTRGWDEKKAGRGGNFTTHKKSGASGCVLRLLRRGAGCQVWTGCGEKRVTREKGGRPARKKSISMSPKRTKGGGKPRLLNTATSVATPPKNKRATVARGVGPVVVVLACGGAARFSLRTGRGCRKETTGDEKREGGEEGGRHEHNGFSRHPLASHQKKHSLSLAPKAKDHHLSRAPRFTSAAPARA